MDKKDTVLPIRGMHCPSCPLLVEESLSSLPGIEAVRAFLSKKTCSLQYDPSLYPTEENLHEAINHALAPHGFCVQKKGERTLEPGFFSARNIAFMLLAAFVAYSIWNMLLYLENNLSFLENFDTAETAAGGWFMPFMMGLAASLSCCVAVTGSVIIGFAARYGAGKKKRALVGMNSSLQAGRLISFFVLGGLLGMLGTTLALSGNTLAVLYGLLALLLFSLGLSMLDLPVSLLPFRLPSSMGLIQRLGKKQGGLGLPFMVGCLTFFIPCGFSLSMMLFALQTHSFLQGGLTMLFFALGTLPVLFVVGLTASFSSHKGFAFVRKTMAFLLLFFGFSLMQSAAVYWGFSGNILALLQPKEAYAWFWSSEAEPVSPEKTPLFSSASTSSSASQGGTAIIEMRVTGRTFSPSTLHAEAGQEITWNIVGERVSPCANRIIIPSLNISLPIKNGLNSLTFKMPDKPGPLPFSCWMGMENGQFLVQSPKD